MIREKSKELKFEHLDSPIKVYNFEVEDWHTYFVSEHDVFVHNSCGGKGKALSPSEASEKITSAERTGSGLKSTYTIVLLAIYQKVSFHRNDFFYYW